MKSPSILEKFNVKLHKNAKSECYSFIHFNIFIQDDHFSYSSKPANNFFV